MSVKSDKIILAKNALAVALGDNFHRYLNNLKLWFRHKWTKEEFDKESRKLLTTDNIHLHNQFLLAIFNKIDAFNQPSSHSTPVDNSSSRKRKKNTSGDRVTFEPYDICDYLDEDSMEFIRPPNSSLDDNHQQIPPQRYCVQELFLPDSGFLMGRLLVGAWEYGLINVDDAVAEYVSVALQMLLKNILTTIILKRKHYRTNTEGKFFYDVGLSLKHPFLKNTLKQKIDDAPLELDKEISSAQLLRKTNDEITFLSSCEELYPVKKRIITVRDVYKAMKDRNILPSHSVYSINMERITQMLH